MLERKGKTVQRYKHPVNLADKGSPTVALEAAEEIQHFSLRYDLKADAYKYTLVDEATLVKELAEEKEKLVVKRELFVNDSFANPNCPKYLLLEHGLLYDGLEVYQTIDKELVKDTHNDPVWLS